MKKLESQIPRHCPGCGRRLLVGAMAENWSAKLREMGLRRVLGMHSGVKPEEADGVFLSDIIYPGIRCLACGSEVYVTVEVEYSDRCELCDNRPAAYEWDEARNGYIGLCESCAGSPAGGRWELARAGLDEYLEACAVCGGEPLAMFYVGPRKMAGLCRDCWDTPAGAEIQRLGRQFDPES